MRSRRAQRRQAAQAREAFADLLGGELRRVRESWDERAAGRAECEQRAHAAGRARVVQDVPALRL